MTPGEKGRFCDSCQKKVHDFTASPDREIVAAIAKDSRLCGRFRGDQLNRELILPKDRKRWWPLAAASISFLTLGTYQGTAQEPVKAEQNHDDDGPLTGDTIVVSQKYRITGTLKDIKAMPVPNGKIGFHNKPVCIVTDDKGKFIIEAEEGEEISLETPEGLFIIIDPNPSLPETIKVRIWQSHETRTMGLVANITERTEKNRTFFGRLFHSIGNLFR